MRTTLVIALCLGSVYNIFGCHCLGASKEERVPTSRGLEDAIAHGLFYLLTRDQGSDVNARIEELLSNLPDDRRMPVQLWLENGLALMGQSALGNAPSHADGGHQRLDGATHGPPKAGNCEGCHKASAPSDPKGGAPASAIGTASSCKSSCRDRDDSHCKNTAGCGMSAYFEDSYESTILFSIWRTLGAKSYFASLLLIFILSLLTVFLKVGRKRLTNFFLKGGGRFSQAWKHAVLASLAFVVTFMDFCMMLIVMTFNVGIVLVVCAGYAIGYVLTCYTSVLLEGTEDAESPIECEADCC
ncbi:putative Copper transporter 1 [Babesia divergens]|uniref:Copper transport protein n=1 Tax=Babesia divergens TaxID=32595 RepID=A0AAD9GJB0_BABDI|nr:putative Copper transporter 1 [Babesia divergens]